MTNIPTKLPISVMTRSRPVKTTPQRKIFIPEMTLPMRRRETTNVFSKFAHHGQVYSPRKNLRIINRSARSSSIIVGTDNPCTEILIGFVKVFNLDRVTSSKYLRLNCPWSEENVGKEDTKGHLNFYLDNSFSRCMRCGAWATVQRLFQRLGLNLPIDLKTGQQTPSTRKQIEEQLLAIQVPLISATVPNLEEPPEIELPPGSIAIARLSDRIALHRRVLDKLRSWKINLDVATQLGWQWCVPTDSFIFPVLNFRGQSIY
jgi:hypothetical protein